MGLGHLGRACLAQKKKPGRAIARPGRRISTVLATCQALSAYLLKAFIVVARLSKSPSFLTWAHFAPRPFLPVAARVMKFSAAAVVPSAFTSVPEALTPLLTVSSGASKGAAWQRTRSSV